MKAAQLARRFLVPPFALTLHYYRKHRCLISPRSEVDFSPNLSIGEGTRISSFTKIKATDGVLTIGKHVDVGCGAFISAGAGGVEIGDYTMISPNVSIVGNNYRFDRLDVPVALQEKTSMGIRIGADVWLGAGCVVLDGAEIGDHCIVRPNSVVMGRLAEGTVAEGSPAKPLFVRRA